MRNALILPPILFSSPHMGFGIQIRGLWKPLQSLNLLSVNHFCVDLELCFGSLSCWKIPWWLSFGWGSWQRQKSFFFFFFTINFLVLDWVFVTLYRNRILRAFGSIAAPWLHSCPPPYFTLRGLGCVLQDHGSFTPNPTLLLAAQVLYCTLITHPRLEPSYKQISNDIFTNL